ncbi:MAG: SDR family oxidoreductase [Caulobacteraceae bacterium]|nr:SDR family oxidoreductase [Caulobacter sp.]
MRGPVLVLGARSDVGREVARAYAALGLPVILAARDAEALAVDAADLSVRSGTGARAVKLDVLDVDPEAFFDSLGETPRTVVSVIGLLGDQRRAETDAAYARTVIDTNFTGPAALLAEAAERMCADGGGGAVIGVSSVAGERGRKTNYVYGAAKAGLTAFLSGLRHRLAGTDVLVMTVKPGFIDTRMTAGMKLPKPVTAQPEEVAAAILAAHRKRREVVYAKPVWAPIMAVIRHLPEPVFKRMKV